MMENTGEQIIVDGHVVHFDEAEALSRLEHDTQIGVDIETASLAQYVEQAGGLSPWKGQIALLQLYGRETGTLFMQQTPWGLSKNMREFLSRRGVTLVGHNITNFDLAFLHNAGVNIDGGQAFYDTLIGEGVVSVANRPGVRKDLGTSIKRRTGIEVKKAIEHGNWLKELTREQIEYAARDVLALHALKQAQEEKAAELAQKQIARRRSKTVLDALAFEMSLIPAVAGMNIVGMPVDEVALERYVQETRIKRDAAREALFAATGEFNPNSHLQVKRLFERYNITLPNVQEETIAELEMNEQAAPEARELAGLLRTFKHLEKRVTTYGEEWKRYIQPDGRVHFRFWQAGTDTGRFSSSDPQGQNLPRDMRFVFGMGQEMEKVPYIISASDYSQIEVYVMFWYAQDEVGMEALTKEDIHRANAAIIFDIPEAEVPKDKRKLAKGVTFGVQYVGSARAVYAHCKTYGAPVTLAQAEDLRLKWLSRFQGAARMQEKARLVARNSAYYWLDLPTGFTRLLTKREGTLTPQRIVNTIVQGTAAAGIKYGLLEAYRQGLTQGKLAAQVHDELVSVIPNNKEREEYREAMEQAMLKGMGEVLPIPAKVSTHQGPTWAADD